MALPRRGNLSELLPTPLHLHESRPAAGRMPVAGCHGQGPEAVRMLPPRHLSSLILAEGEAVPAASGGAALLLPRLLHPAAVTALPEARSQGRGELGAKSERKGIVSKYRLSLAYGRGRERASGAWREVG